MPRRRTKDAFVFESGTNGYELTKDDLVAMKAQDQYLYLSREERLIDALEAADREGVGAEIGRLLGYPRCCRAAYSRLKTISDAACLNAAARRSGPGPYPLWSNVARLGKPLILHFPCSLDCRPSAALGRRHFKALARLDPEYADGFRRDLGRAVFLGEGIVVNFQEDAPAFGVERKDCAGKGTPARSVTPLSSRAALVDGRRRSGRLLLFRP